MMHSRVICTGRKTHLSNSKRRDNKSDIESNGRKIRQSAVPRSAFVSLDVPH